MLKKLIIFTFLCVFTFADRLCDKTNAVYKISSNATIIGFLNLFYGPNCSFINDDGYEIVQATLSSIEAIKENNIIPGINIGISLYDTCSINEIAQKSIMASIVDSECNQEYILGSFSAGDAINEHNRKLSKQLDLPVIPLDLINYSLLIERAVQLIFEFHWTPINYLIVTKEHNMEEKFVNEASIFKLCIENIINLPINDVKFKIAINSTVIIIGKLNDVKDILENINNFNTLFVPLDGVYDHYYSSKVFNLLPTTLIANAKFIDTFENARIIDINNYKTDNDNGKKLQKSNGTVLQMEILTNILHIIVNFKTYLLNYCDVKLNEWKICSNLPKIKTIVSRTPLTNTDISRNMKFLKIKEFEGYVIVKENMKIGTFRFADNNWFLEDLDYNKTKNLQLCDNSEKCERCVNFEIMEEKYIVKAWMLNLKNEAWVAALLSICIVGILCCIAVAVFIIVRICNKDVLEGNPGFSFIMLVSLIFIYLSVLPYMFEVKNDDNYMIGILCALKIFGTTLSYSSIFSIMLARSILLASSDQEGGFMSHINGYLQTTLCFFICLVQVALTIQFWAVNWLLLTEEQCKEMTNGTLFLFLLIYNVFLLFLLLCVTPFICKSKRNYYEGGYFTASTIVCTVIWIVWCTLYCLFPNFQDISVCCGLVATATTILLIIFIPRTYLMLTGIVRDHIVSTLPHTTSTSVVDINYRSTQSLYDTVNASRVSHLNQNYYSNDGCPTPSTTIMENTDKSSPEMTYERYGDPPSPQNTSITRF